MLVLEHLPNSEISHKIYVAANPYIQSLDNKNELKEIISVKKDKVTVIDSDMLRKYYATTYKTKLSQ